MTLATRSMSASCASSVASRRQATAAIIAGAREDLHRDGLGHRDQVGGLDELGQTAVDGAVGRVVVLDPRRSVDEDHEPAGTSLGTSAMACV
jgi:hypothetical protein